MEAIENNGTSSYQILQYLTGLLIYPVVCIFGFFANLLTIIVFSRSKRLSSTTVYLIALALSDVLKLINDFLYFPVVLIILLRGSILPFHYMYPYAFFFSQFISSVSAWLTIAIALERFVYIVILSNYKSVIPTHKAVFYSILIYMVLFVFTLPCVNKFRVTCNIDNKTNCELQVTEMWKPNQLLEKLYWPIQTTVRSFIPLFILVMLNIQIIRSLHKTRSNKRLKARNKVTLVLILVIFGFMIFTLPDTVMSAMGFGYFDADQLSTKSAREITDALLTVHSVYNFFIYQYFNTKFKIKFHQILSPFSHKYQQRSNFT